MLPENRTPQVQSGAHYQSIPGYQCQGIAQMGAGFHKVAKTMTLQVRRNDPALDRERGGSSRARLQPTNALRHAAEKVDSGEHAVAGEGVLTEFFMAMLPFQA